MPEPLPRLDQRLLDDFQRDLPLVPAPFAEIARKLETTESQVLRRLAALRDRGCVARVGATVAPNTAGASTLAAMAVPAPQLDSVARAVGAEPGVNHSYQRDHKWNLWFVATAPSERSLEDSLGRLERRTGLRILDLRLIRPFNVDLGFPLSGARKAAPKRREPDLSALRDGDRPILHGLSQGLALEPRPFATLARDLGRSEDDVLRRVAALADAGILSRVGVIVRHRAIGWRENAMVVWDLPASRIDAAGRALASHPGVTLCYRRRAVPGAWPYELYCMIHARDRAESDRLLASAAALPELGGARHEKLRTVRCFKQGAAVLDVAPGRDRPESEAA